VSSGHVAPAGEFVELALGGGKTGRILFFYAGNLVDAKTEATSHDAVRSVSNNPYVFPTDASVGASTLGPVADQLRRKCLLGAARRLE
jgi:hypothetical protein